MTHLSLGVYLASDLDHMRSVTFFVKKCEVFCEKCDVFLCEKCDTLVILFQKV